MHRVFPRVSEEQIASATSRLWAFLDATFRSWRAASRLPLSSASFEEVAHHQSSSWTLSFCKQTSDRLRVAETRWHVYSSCPEMIGERVRDVVVVVGCNRVLQESFIKFRKSSYTVGSVVLYKLLFRLQRMWNKWWFTASAKAFWVTVLYCGQFLSAT